MITAPYFLATKIVAFENRGKGDYIASRDMLTVQRTVAEKAVASPEQLSQLLSSLRRRARPPHVSGESAAVISGLTGR